MVQVLINFLVEKRQKINHIIHKTRHQSHSSRSTRKNHSGVGHGDNSRLCLSQKNRNELAKSVHSERPPGDITIAVSVCMLVINVGVWPIRLADNRWQWFQDRYNERYGVYYDRHM